MLMEADLPEDIEALRALALEQSGRRAEALAAFQAIAAASPPTAPWMELVNQHIAANSTGVPLAEHFSVPHFSAVPYIVSATDLLATVPEKLAASAAQPFGLRYMTPPVKVPALQTNMYWQRRYDRDGGNQWLRALIVNAFAVGSSPA